MARGRGTRPYPSPSDSLAVVLHPVYAAAMERRDWISIGSALVALGALGWNVYFSQHHLAISQQAWMAPRPSVTFNAEDSTASVTAGWTNTGNGPAKNMVSSDYIYFATDKDLLQPNIDRQMKDLTTGWQGNMGAKYRVALIGRGDTVVRSVQASIVNIQTLFRGHSVLWVAGRAEYDDVMGNPHSTLYCLLYSPTSEAFIPCESGNFAE